MSYINIHDTSAIWRFPSNDNGEDQGFSNSGVENFSNRPSVSLAREICQNSLDAKRKDQSMVQVEFHVFDYPVSEIPGIDALKDAIQRCDEYWKDNNNAKNKAFFQRLKRATNRETCTVMRISDFNTTGLHVDKDWNGLVKSSGASTKSGSGKLGSFGQGKYATFGCSDLRTVFYSTYDEDGKEACQGVARLTTFRTEEGNTTSGVWFYGDEKNTPMKEQLSLDPDFRRGAGQFGTDIYIVSFRKNENDTWKEDIIASILSSFMVAIQDGRLSVTVGDETINSSSLEDIMSRYSSYIESEGGYRALPAYYVILKSPDTIWDSLPVWEYGSMKLGLLNTEDKTPKHIAMYRSSGMMIKEDKYLLRQSPFTGICIMEGDKLNEVLRDMEPPEHDDWFPDRAETVKETVARALLKEIKNLINECVKSKLKSSDDDSVEVVGLGQLIPDIGDDESKRIAEETPSDEINNITGKKERKLQGKPKIIQKPGSNPVYLQSDDGNYRPVPGAEANHYQHGGGQITPNPDSVPKEGSFEEGEGHPGFEKVYRESAFIKFKPICVNKESGSYVLIIVPSESSESSRIKLMQSAEVGNYELPIVSAKIRNPEGIISDLEIKGNCLEGLALEAGKEYRITLKVDYNDYCTMEKAIYVS